MDALRTTSTVLGANGLGTAFINSLVVTIPAVVIPITMAAFAAYAFAWMRFPGRRLLFALVVAMLVVPIQMSLVPVLRLYAGLDLNGTFLGVWLAHTGFGLPLAIFLLYNYISQLPGDLFESAAIDGASHFQIFRELVVPLSVPALASFAIFQFLWVWNDLLVALVYLGTEASVGTLPARLNELVGTTGRGLAPADGGGVRDDDRAAHRVPAAPAVLRPGADRGVGQGVTSGAAPRDAILGRVMLAFEGERLPDWVAARLAAAPVAGMTVFRHHNVRSPGQVRELTEAFQRAGRRGAARRGPGGVGGRPAARRRGPGRRAAPGAWRRDRPRLPGTWRSGAVGDEDLAERVGRAIGRRGAGAWASTSSTRRCWTSRPSRPTRRSGFDRLATIRPPWRAWARP